MKINLNKIGALLLTGTLVLTSTSCQFGLNHVQADAKESNPKKDDILVEEVVNPEEKQVEHEIEDSFYEIGDYVYTTTDLNFREKPNLDSKVVSTIEPFEKLERIKTNDIWNLVVYNGIKGYVNSDYIAVLPDKYVEVDISDQKVYLYNLNTQLINSSVVTGKDLTPTRIGYFNIYLKQQNTYLTGPGYSSHVNYWMPFDGGIGLHDANWRDEFGGTIYKNEGSHGCVNMDAETAQTMYENTEVGTKVLVHN